MDEVSGYLIGFNNDASLGGVYTGLGPDLQFLPLSVIASVVLMLIYGTILGIARAFNSNEVERFAKAELLNGLATIVMVACLILILTSIEDFILQYFICTGEVCPSFDCGSETITIDQLTSSIDLLKCRLADKASAFASMLPEIESAASVPFNLLNLYIALIGIPVFSGQYVTAWYKDAETYRLLNHFITVLLIGLNALVVIADYVKNNMLSFFLPIGLLLRSFFFTRGVGALLVALSISFYFIYPVVYIITDPGFVKPSFSAQSKPPDFQSPLCFPTFSGISYTLYTSMSSSSTSAASGGVLSLTQLKSDVSSVYSSVLLQPFIAFAITVVFIRYITTILGGEAMDVLRAVGKVV